ncbi:ninja-family protein AFP3-like [Iris pallida]|uniref:Ninja-family protein n=1 Tax=Iris pallida TaxID=29817 RepID=A0AAX6H0D9_IRIPA|nr:ninja-family protein AFP3-like [Iris pallida]
MMEASSKDLLVRFAGSTSLSERPPAAAPSPEAAVELSLGLSLGGCFGSENREKTKLIRSSSISSFPFFASDILSSSSSPSSSPAKEAAAKEPLARTWSLPVAGVEEDYRKRKELQSLKRMEAKRKRSERRNSVARTASTAAAEDFGGCPWPPGSRRSATAAARGSSSGSSGGSGDARPMKGLDIPKFSRSPEAKSPPSSLPPAGTLRSTASEQPSKRIERRGSWTGEMERSMMEEMPCVSTRGDGPDGRRVEGFLYKYRKGEEVRIVCVCHGSFLTPAEFVRHAGGAGNVDHPLKHIVVNHRTPSALV